MNRKKFLSFLTALALTCSIIPNSLYAVTNDSSKADNIAETYLSSAVPASESYDGSDSDFGITNVEYSRGTAEVTLAAAKDCTVVVGLYNDDGSKLITSGYASVSPLDTSVDVQIDESAVPKHFYIKAYLIETATMKPLCVAYESQMYTQAMETFLSMTADDFPENKVTNFDDDNSTNFAVVKEGVKLVKCSQGENTMLYNSSEGSVSEYIIGNINSDVQSIKVGEVFVLEYTGRDFKNIIYGTLQSIDIKDNAARISMSEGILQDVFDYFRLEDEEGKYIEVMDYNEPTPFSSNAKKVKLASENTDKPMVMSSRNTQFAESSAESAAVTIADDAEESTNGFLGGLEDLINDGDGVKYSFSIGKYVSLSGKIKLDISGIKEFFSDIDGLEIDEAKTLIEITNKYDLSASIGLTPDKISETAKNLEDSCNKELEEKPIKLKGGNEVPLSVKFTADIFKLSYGVKGTWRSSWDIHRSFLFINVITGENNVIEDVSELREFIKQTGGAETVYAGAHSKIAVTITLDLFKKSKFNISGSLECGVKADLEVTSNVPPSDPKANECHACYNCVSFVCGGYFYVNLDGTNLDKNDKYTIKVTKSKELDKLEKMLKYYWSPYNEWETAEGECEYKAYKVKLKVVNEAGNPVSKAAVSMPTFLKDTYYTDENGELTAWAMPNADKDANCKYLRIAPTDESSENFSLYSSEFDNPPKEFIIEKKLNDFGKIVLKSEVEDFKVKSIKSHYLVGEPVDLATAVLSVKYKGSSEWVEVKNVEGTATVCEYNPDGIAVDAYKPFITPEKEGVYQPYLNYEGKTRPIGNVTWHKEIAKVEIEKYPDKTEYMYGEEFSHDGGAFKVIYGYDYDDNPIYEIVPMYISGSSFNFKIGEGESKKDEFNTDEYGTHTITLYYFYYDKSVGKKVVMEAGQFDVKVLEPKAYIKVVNSETNEPVASASVHIITRGNHKSETVQTDSEGYAEISFVKNNLDPSEGIYSCWIEKSKYNTKTIYPKKSDDIEIDLGTVELDPITVTYTLVDGVSGNPIPNATMTVSRDNQEVLTKTADANGVVKMSFLDDNIAWDKSYMFAFAFTADGYSDISYRNNYINSTKKDEVLMYRQGGIVTGKVCVDGGDRGKAPVYYADVKFITEKNYNEGSKRAYATEKTNSDGLFTVSLPAGRYYVQVVSNDSSIKDYISTECITVTDNDTLDLGTVELERNGSASAEGIVIDTDTGDVIAGATVKFTGSYFTQTVTTNSNGNFEFSNVPYCNATITVEAEGYCEYYSKNNIHSDQYFTNIALIPIPESGETSGFWGIYHDFTHDNGEVERVSGSSVVIYKGFDTTGEVVYRGKTDVNGECRFDDFPYGYYTVWLKSSIDGVVMIKTFTHRPQTNSDDEMDPIEGETTETTEDETTDDEASTETTAPAEEETTGDEASAETTAPAEEEITGDEALTETTAPTSEKTVIETAEATSTEAYASNITGMGGIAEFKNLKGGVIYNFYVMRSKNAAQPYSKDNMLYINQGTADAQGRLLVSFVLKENVSDTDIFVVPMGNNGGSVSLNTGASSDTTDPSVPSIPTQPSGNGSTVSRTLERIEVTKMPYKTIYAINKDKLDVSGGKITLYYSDNSKNIISMTSKMVSGFDNTKSGKQTLTVTYNGKTAQFDVEVGEVEDVSAASGIEIDTSIIDFSYNNAGWICLVVIITAAGVMLIKRRQNK